MQISFLSDAYFRRYTVFKQGHSVPLTIFLCSYNRFNNVRNKDKARSALKLQPNKLERNNVIFIDPLPFR